MHSTLSVSPTGALRLTGAGVAFLLGLAIFALLQSWHDKLAAAMAISTPLVAACVGWAMAPRTRSPGWRPAVATVLGFGVTAVVLGSFAVLAVSLVTASGTTPSGPIEGLAMVIFGGLLGILYLGLPILLAGFVPIAIWLVIMQRLAPRLAPRSVAPR